jgi:branched-chain amino acid transport system ATP-binding protein
VSFLELRAVGKAYRGLRAVSNVSLSVEAQSIVALIGPNGAGKTTLFNMIAGAQAPDCGKIVYCGRSIAGLRPDQICALGIARTFQIVRPFAALSVLDNVTVGALQRRPVVAEARGFAATIIDRLGLGAKRHQPASSLTLPERKRLEIARALATAPRLLLLDEVMAGLRPAECDRLVAFLREIRGGERLTILVIEHVMRAVMALAEKVIVLHQGEVLAAGRPDVVVADQAVRDCYLGTNIEP